MIKWVQVVNTEYGIRSSRTCEREISVGEQWLLPEGAEMSPPTRLSSLRPRPAATPAQLLYLSGSRSLQWLLAGLFAAVRSVIFAEVWGRQGWDALACGV